MITSLEEYKSAVNYADIKQITFKAYDAEFVDDIIKFTNLEEIDMQIVHIENIETLHYICDNIKKIRCAIIYENIMIGITKNIEFRFNIFVKNANSELVKNTLSKLINNLPNSIDKLSVTHQLLLTDKFSNLPPGLKEFIIITGEDLRSYFWSKLSKLRIPHSCKIKLSYVCSLGIRFSDFCLEQSYRSDDINIESNGWIYIGSNIYRTLMYKGNEN
jgi:hypothetical protein